MFKINEIVCFESNNNDKSLLSENKTKFNKPMFGVVVDIDVLTTINLTIYSILSNNMIFKVPNVLIKKT
jgi:hypothetical protein